MYIVSKSKDTEDNKCDECHEKIKDEKKKGDKENDIPVKKFYSCIICRQNFHEECAKGFESRSLFSTKKITS